MNMSEYFAMALSSYLPAAIAFLSGNGDHPGLHGMVKFYQTSYDGILISAEVFGLPTLGEGSKTGFFAMHIHEKGDCTLPFSRVGEHYNPMGAPHPEHAGDLLPLLADHGYAWSAFFDDRLSVNEILGKSVIIHGGYDDFTTQPSGNAGEKIGCGMIQAVAR